MHKTADYWIFLSGCLPLFMFHCFILLTFIMPPPRRGGGALSGDRRPSVCPSDVAYIGSNSKTKRPRKTKLCIGVPQVTCDSHTDFKVKGQKSRSRGQLVQCSAAKCVNISQTDKATPFKFGTHIGRGQFLPVDHTLAPKTYLCKIARRKCPPLIFP